MRRKKSKLPVIIAVLTIILLVFILFICNNKNSSIPLENIAAFRISAETLENVRELSEKYQIGFTKLLTIYMVQNSFFNEKLYSDEDIERMLVTNMEKTEKEWDKNEFLAYYKLIDNIINDVKFFPVSDNNGYVYSDSWGAERTYGGKRIHEGCDIFDKENICGRLQIVSMTDGVIEKIGWNEKGGWRIGVRSDSGNYYYYAHFMEYAENISEGDRIKAGSVLGLMGDSGYGNQGTTGKFPVHLHVGICAETEITKDEFWINPYPFLTLIQTGSETS